VHRLGGDVLGQPPDHLGTVRGDLQVVAIGKFQDVQCAVGHVGDAVAGGIEARVDDWTGGVELA
jgi:hypothetical protein